MTPEEYCLLDNHNYSFFTEKMGGIFNEWHDKKIDGITAIHRLKHWHSKGMRKLDNVNHSNIQKKELEKFFNSFALYIEDNDMVVDEKLLSDNYEDHILMRLLIEVALTAYKTLKKAIALNIVVYENGYFNFKCARGCVGLIFSTAGFTDYKTINRYILINEKPPAKSTLINGVKNPSPNEWPNIEKQLFY